VSGLVRVTVTSSNRRVDLALSGGVPVVELVPELARCVGLLDMATAHAGYRVVTRDGRVLCNDLGLTAQGVGHGDMIAIGVTPADEPPTAHDDLAEALTDVLARGVEPWGPGWRRPTTLWSAVVLLLLGAGALATQHATGSAASAASVAAVLSVVLVVSAIFLSRARHETVAAVTLGNLACVYSAAAGLSWGWRTTMSGTPATLAGVGVLGIGIVGALGMAKSRLLLMPAVVAGAVCLATGLLMQSTPLDPALPMTMLLALVLISSSGFPTLALSASGAGRHASSGTSICDHDPLRIDMARLAEDARLAREILSAASATVGLLLVLLAPVAVSCGPVGAAVPSLGCAVVILRTRRYRSALDVLLGVLSGVLGLVSTVLSLLWLHREWQFLAAIVVAAAGVVLLGQTLWPRTDVRRHGRAGDRIEAAAVVWLLPALLMTALSDGRIWR
jgi:ESX secretion system protein EccD